MKPNEDSDEVELVVFINDKVILMYILGTLVGSFVALRNTRKTQQAKPAARYWSVELFINQTT